VIVVDGKAYAYVSKAYFKYLHTTQHVAASMCWDMCGKYLQLSAKAFRALSLPVLSSLIVSQIPVPTSVPGLKTVTYQGQSAYLLTDGTGTALYVAKNGTHYLLGMVAPGNVRLTFSQWNAVPPATAPPASKIFTG
jgi:hypothetical protein